MELKTIDPKTKEFTANGNTYVIYDKISIDRFMQYEKLVPRLTYGLSFKEMQANISVAYQYLNKQNFADASVVLHNILNGITKIEEETRVHPALLMASLIVNKKDEDIRYFDEEVAMKKINDWQVEGLDMLGFFHLSIDCIEGFKGTLIEYIQRKSLEISTLIEKS